MPMDLTSPTRPIAATKFLSSKARASGQRHADLGSDSAVYDAVHGYTIPTRIKMHRSLGQPFTWLLLAALTITLVPTDKLPAQSAMPPLANSALPPLAWSSWNSFSNLIDSTITMQQAQALISTGLHRSGYEYVNIDEGWWLGDRDADGHFVID